MIDTQIWPPFPAKTGEPNLFFTVIGDDVRVGDPAPEFIAAVQGWKPVNPIAESRGKVIILPAVPALDTEVCDRETRRFNKEASGLSEDVVIACIQHNGLEPDYDEVIEAAEAAL